MAFVFRSENSPSFPFSKDTSLSSGQESQEQKSLMKRKPLKGLPCKQNIEEVKKEVKKRTSFEEQIDKKVKQFGIIRKNTKLGTNKEEKERIYSENIQNIGGKIPVSEKKIPLFNFPKQKNEREKFISNRRDNTGEGISKILKFFDGIKTIPSIPVKRKEEKSLFGAKKNSMYPGLDQSFHDAIHKKPQNKGSVKLGLSYSKSTSKTDFPIIQDKSEKQNLLKQILDTAEKKKKDFKRKPNFQKKHTAMTKSDDDDSEQSQYDSLATPGPGSYDFDLSKKKEFRSKNIKHQKIFINKSKRFHEKKLIDEPETEFLDPQERSKKKINFFLSKIPRQIHNSGKEQIPAPNYYDTRQTMQHHLINKMLKNSSIGTLNNKIPRFTEDSLNEVPGPGYYNPEPLEFKEHQSPKKYNSKTQYDKVKEAMIAEYKKNLKCFEKSLLVTDQQKFSQIIHKRPQKYFEEQNYAPFMSSTPKFSAFEETEKDPVRYSKESQKIRQNNEAFNSSQIKFYEPKNESKAAVGLYDISREDEWIKKSYNVLYN